MKISEVPIGFKFNHGSKGEGIIILIFNIYTNTKNKNYASKTP